jgi:hypothetical protein
VPGATSRTVRRSPQRIVLFAEEQQCDKRNERRDSAPARAGSAGPATARQATKPPDARRNRPPARCTRHRCTGRCTAGRDSGRRPATRSAHPRRPAALPTHTTWFGTGSPRPAPSGGPPQEPRCRVRRAAQGGAGVRRRGAARQGNNQVAGRDRCRRLRPGGLRRTRAAHGELSSGEFMYALRSPAVGYGRSAPQGLAEDAPAAAAYPPHRPRPAAAPSPVPACRPLGFDDGPADDLPGAPAACAAPAATRARTGPEHSSSFRSGHPVERRKTG